MTHVLDVSSLLGEYHDETVLQVSPMTKAASLQLFEVHNHARKCLSIYKI